VDVRRAAHSGALVDLGDATRPRYIAVPTGGDALGAVTR
jgi:hypothetical protein